MSSVEKATEIAELEQRWKHASQVAFQSIGQPDRDANVAYREELASKLRAARDAWTQAGEQ